MVHGRPIASHMTLPHLTPARTEPLLELGSLVQVSAGKLSSGRIPPDEEVLAELRAMRAAGWGLIAVHPGHAGRARARAVTDTLDRVLGPARWAWPPEWFCWELPPAEPEG
jgi:hypothetical protein